ncbi:hypothetical protein [Rhizobium sp. RM]|uniref:hypothetical protein n=1 Tax=Rhizobium sp. RM TaxID=2748079 RepID=UPI00110DDB58|nr:hypothetical protein [Rhizobium sp. RM]NWJ26071.1 hypothetical protein [Rhizobium sp. RM]TMV20673.1 hypothetical protein BJG94_08195 [Rhizobium sp. Td3]
MDDGLIDTLQSTIDTAWEKTGLGAAVRVRTTRQDDGSPHVEIRRGLYEIVVTERGQETQRMSGLSLPDAARWFLSGMAFGHACASELKDRRAPENAPPLDYGLKDDGYSRWNWMAPAIATMHRISPEMGAFMEQHYAEVLRHAPLNASEKRNARYPLLPFAA